MNKRNIIFTIIILATLVNIAIFVKNFKDNKQLNQRVDKLLADYKKLSETCGLNIGSFQSGSEKFYQNAEPAI